MPRGVIRSVKPNQGYGFIDSSRGEVFFHSSVLRGAAIEQLSPGTDVEYESKRTDKGLRATFVRPISDESD